MSDQNLKSKPDNQDSESVKPARSRSFIPPIIIASVTAIICTVLLAFPISQDELYVPEKLITDTLIWDGVEIEYTWISTSVRTEYENAVPETLTFAKGMIKNTATTDLEVSSATLMLVETNQVVVDSLTLTLPSKWIVRPGQSRPIELEGWVPSGLIKDIVGLNGRLAFSHKEEE